MSADKLNLDAVVVELLFRVSGAEAVDKLSERCLAGDDDPEMDKYVSDHLAVLRGVSKFYFRVDRVVATELFTKGGTGSVEEIFDQAFSLFTRLASTDMWRDRDLRDPLPNDLIVLSLPKRIYGGFIKLADNGVGLGRLVIFNVPLPLKEGGSNADIAT